MPPRSPGERLTEIAIERHGGAVVVGMTGELDVTNAARFGTELKGSMPGDAEALVLDLSGTRYLDSAALAAIFDVAGHLERRGRSLRLVVPASSPLRRLLLVAEVESVMRVHDTLDAALVAVRKG